MVQQVNVNFIINENAFLFTTVWEKEKLHEVKSTAKKKKSVKKNKNKTVTAVLKITNTAPWWMKI